MCQNSIIPIVAARAVNLTALRADHVRALTKAA